MRIVLALALLSAPALADPLPPPVQTFFPVIQPSGLTARITPFITVPAAPEPFQGAANRIQYVTQASTGRLFINDLGGVVYTAAGAGGVAAPYLDMSAQVYPTVNPAGPGLGGVALHPNFAGTPGQPGYGVFYTSASVPTPAPGQAASPTLGNGTGPAAIEIREWTTANPAAPSFTGTSRSVLTLTGNPDVGHSNALIAFNPTARPGSADYGNLYIGNGDGAFNDLNRLAQDPGAAQGKLLRINPLPGPNGEAYTVSAGNPFVGQGGKLPEVYASGLRYPQTFSWDALTGTMFVNDLGAAFIEEVNVVTPGANFGWSDRAGTYATGYAYGQDANDENLYPWPAGVPVAPFTDPIAVYSHDEGYAVGSGFVYRGSAIAGLYGKYVMQDIVNGRIFVFDPAGVPPGGQAVLTELALTLDGSPFNLRAALGYEGPFNNPRLDARLSETNDHELLMALKANGIVYALGSLDVPEPASAAVLGVALLGLAARKRTRRRTAG